MAAINAAGTGGYAVGDMGSTNNVDTLKNIWFDDQEAWEGINDVSIPFTSITLPPAVRSCPLPVVPHLLLYVLQCT